MDSAPCRPREPRFLRAALLPALLLATGCFEFQFGSGTPMPDCRTPGISCQPGQACFNGTCVCPVSSSTCGGECVNTASDVHNCGGCGMACAADQWCAAGACVCSTPLLACGGGCVDTRSDDRHCGGCGVSCAIAERCTDSSCSIVAPAACGAACPGGCCAGPVCATEHVNGPAALGFGQPWYDCGPLRGPGSWSLAAATLAATAWGPTGWAIDATTCGPGCLGWIENVAPFQCAVWCYTGSTREGLVFGPSDPGTVNNAIACGCAGAAQGSWR